MDTETLNITTGGGASDKSGKNDKAKTVVGKAAQFAGAAGVGVAGTMAANTINKNGETTTDEISEVTPHTVENGVSEDIVAETATDFNPNDIMIDVTEVTAEDAISEHPGGSTASLSEDIIEPQPISMENITDSRENETDIVSVEPDIDPEVEILEIDGLGVINNDEFLLTGNEPPLTDNEDDIIYDDIEEYGLGEVDISEVDMEDNPDFEDDYIS